ncbi:MAG: CHAT domain-containing protein [Nostoc sp. ChiSLP02]|nr:CHAT domain-containing protein [Nostoc sp. DedSLP05]MDZ8098300.1 CHAT domain-containing protein [Nostoc sp. DedSLP01]MDZ8185774.1 CHAT domain-containing protein [Nostoc sp. ChiSLP02]
MSNRLPFSKNANIFVFQVTNLWLLFSMLTLPVLVVTESREVAIAQTRNERKKEALRLNQVGVDRLRKGRFQEALETLEQALLICKEIGERQGEGATLNNIGEVYKGLGEYPKALNSHTQALAIFKQIDDKPRQGASFNNIGFAYSSLGQFSEALSNYSQALTVFQQISYKPGEGATLSNIGITYRKLGQYSKALDSYNKALAIAKQIPDKAGEGATLDNIGVIYRIVGQYPKALQFHTQALAVVRQISDKAGEAATLSNIGLVYNDWEQYPKALESHTQALAVVQQIGDKAGEGIALNNIGLAYNGLEQYPKALEFYTQALAIRKKAGDKAGEGNTLTNMGYIFLKIGKYAEAREKLRAAIEIYESLRPGLKDIDKVSLIDTERGTYIFLQQALIAENKTNPALEISERGRARAFAELLAEKQKTQIQLKPTINQLKQIAEEQNAILVEYSIINEEFKIEGKKQWRESQLYIWVVKPTGEVFLRQVDLRRQFPKIVLEDLIASTRQSIGVGGRSLSIETIPVDEPSQQEKLQQLYQILIEPIAKDKLLPQDQESKIIFIPQGSLFLVPFAALRDAKGKFLIEKYTVASAPSIQTLSLTAQQRQRISKASPGSALVLGNPTMPKVSPSIGEPAQQLLPLAGAEAEAKAIAQILETKAITGNKAKKSAILPLLPKARIIHLATHGLLDDFIGLGVPGAIALAPSGNGEPNDGLLTANEILDLKLNAELIVLSACDTGRGRITGDGVIGLSRSLITAGTPSVIVSLWSVPDAPTAELMTEFYRNWLSGKLDKAQALREAMLKTRENHPSPKDWAGFTLIGEAK